jgi:hypothetical protein
MLYFCEDERNGPSQNLLEYVEKVYGLRASGFWTMGNSISHPELLLTGAQKLASSTLAAVEPNGAQPCPKSPGRKIKGSGVLCRKP